MILTDEELFLRINSSSNIASESHAAAVVSLKNSGKRVGDTNLPVETRELIAVLAQSDGVSDVSEEFGLAPSTVSKLSRGLLSDNETVDTDLRSKIDEVNRKPSVLDKTNTAHDRALDVLVSSLDALQPRLADVTKPKDLAKIASDMSRVASTLSGSGGFGPNGLNIGGFGNKVQVIVHAPALKSENDFEVVEA